MGRDVELTSRLQVLTRLAYAAVVLLFVKTFAAVLWEYRFYFPANFSSYFLAGREQIFHGTYRLAFYSHIISGPIALAVATFLMLSGKRKALGHWHRRLGKILAYVVLFVMLPSGLIMALHALTGPIAGFSFLGLTIATSISIGMAAWHVKHRRMVLHQLWATRCFIFLASPLLLRLLTGGTIWFGIESNWTYRIAVWSSWIIPISIFEIRRLTRSRVRQPRPAESPPLSTSEFTMHPTRSS